MSLRRAFREVPKRGKYRFYRAEALRLGVNPMTVLRAVLG